MSRKKTGANGRQQAAAVRTAVLIEMADESSRWVNWRQPGPGVVDVL
jgi:hypothetical protein